jgi:cell wall-associated NlpC family hydrolase
VTSAVWLVPNGASASPQAPTVGSVEQQLTQLATKNMMLIEKFDQAQVDVQRKQAAAVAAQKQASLALQEYGRAGSLLSATATAEYEGGAFSTTGALLSSDSGQSYLDQLQTLEAISTHTTAVITSVAAAKTKADKAVKSADALLTQANAKVRSLIAQREDVQRQVDNYQDLLKTMSYSARTTYQQQTTPAVAAVVANADITAIRSSLNVIADAKERVAASFALAQIGKPYVFATAGPGTYDCSGLTMASWAAAGVSLPHSSEEQFGYGTAVSVANLKPGDLLFYYGPPPGHVTIYVGMGEMVSAPEPGEDVKLVAVSDYSDSFVGARHIG